MVEDFAHGISKCAATGWEWAYFQGNNANEQATKKVWVSSSSVLSLMVGLSQKLTEALEEMRKFMEQRNLDSTPVPILLVVIIPQNAADVRADVKYWDDVEHGESCFCCVRETKICIGGQLNIILTMSLSRALDQLKKDRYMIMGADVGHPGPGTAERPSVTSLVFSHDEHASHYAALSLVQPPRPEMIVDLREMI
ncbi:hypothetical protein AB1N83_013044, partial [Pleurotus pulmonarius]